MYIALLSASGFSQDLNNEGKNLTFFHGFPVQADNLTQGSEVINLLSSVRSRSERHTPSDSVSFYFRKNELVVEVRVIERDASHRSGTISLYAVVPPSESDQFPYMFAAAVREFAQSANLTLPPGTDEIVKKAAKFAQKKSMVENRFRRGLQVLTIASLLVLCVLSFISQQRKLDLLEQKLDQTIKNVREIKREIKEDLMPMLEEEKQIGSQQKKIIELMLNREDTLKLQRSPELTQELEKLRKMTH